MKGKFGLVLMVVLVFGLIFIACNTGSDTNTDSKETPFVPVTDIGSLPQIAIAGTALPLSGIVEPSGATNQTIVWSGNGVNNNSLTATTAGTWPVTATITNGASESSPYTKTFNVEAYIVYDTANGTWKKGSDTIEKNGNNWSITFGTYSYTINGIITMIDGSTAYTQINGTFGPGGTYSPSGYTYAVGTYSVNDDKLTVLSKVS